MCQQHPRNRRLKIPAKLQGELNLPGAAVDALITGHGRLVESDDIVEMENSMKNHYCKHTNSTNNPTASFCLPCINYSISIDHILSKIRYARGSLPLV
ncbi:hypothetical protein PoB_002015300 [Plakobranchus ocellatus]|uniref:Uncharacterized protein n=1 Tax=Plakobranchus ocellatus TaxID=259542 RepID=A0AAV3ZFU7_9GAST|nr:hypothetical protein PoB_002015300 [Plakobranchus ocellatus]